MNELLSTLGLSADEQKVYIELIENGPKSMLQLARNTGVNRTTTYRVIDDLQSRGLVTTIKDDAGSRVRANDPTSLEIGLLNKEQQLQKQRKALSELVPALESMRAIEQQDKRFVVKTYDGINGFKQMLWNELKAEGELLGYGSGTIEDLVGSRRWAEKHRERTADANYTIREIINPKGKPEDFTKSEEFLEKFNKRVIARSVLPLQHQTIIYNNTVNTYCWRDGQKVGFEIVNKAYADTQRAVFESFWLLAK